VTDQGVAVQTLGEVVAGLKAVFTTEFQPVEGELLDVSPDSYTGREILIFSEEYVSAQNLLLTFVELLDAGQAQGVWVDFHLSLQATSRKPATFSTIPALVYGTPDTNVGDRRVRFTPNGTLWRTPAGLVIGANGTAETTLTAVDPGPINAIASGTTLWVIVDRVTSGGSWSAVESTGDVRLGTLVESDDAARRRVIRTAPGIGRGTKPAILATLWAVPGVVDADLNNNRFLVVDANGVPPKSNEAIVDGGSDEDVAAAVLISYSGTAGYYGSTEVFVSVDVEMPDGSTIELSDTVKFTRVTRVPVIARYTISFGNEDAAPDNVADLAKSVAANYINTAGRGVDVIPTASAGAIIAALPALSEPTIVGEVALMGGVLGSTTVPISSRERAIISPEPSPASVTSTNTETFNFDTSWTFTLAVDGGSPFELTFLSTDFLVVSAATALEIATAINRQTTALLAGVDQGAIVLQSITSGAESAIQVSVSSSAALLTELGFTVGTVFGSDGDIEVVVA
jgi:hypothetical protein